MQKSVFTSRFRTHHERFAALIVLSLCCVAAADACRAGEKMMSGFFASSFDNPVALEVAPLRIVPLDRALPLPEATSRVTDASVTRPFVNEQLNSRLEVALPAGSWTVRWRAELEDSVQPLHVLH